ncbi:hypothetical protein [Streptomyces sp. NPDC088725]|uniref:hypothetical protein n=1 Tax=Streptomyces sp. NPDC088725 TaxID=3365873 RepID=UPI0037FF71F0
MTDHAYFEELDQALRAAGVPEERAAATVGDLTGYLAETGTTALDEFGPAAEFAARLTGTGAAGTGAAGDEEPAAEAETWKWTADIYTDRRLLNEYGAQGWEVERIDRLGLFVSRRVPDAAMRWEYRREVTNNARERAGVSAELAPEGWEPCGSWLFLTYYKRPAAATTGPAAELSSTPAQPARRIFLSRTYVLTLAFWLLAVAAVVTYLMVADADVTEPGFLAGAVVGAVVGGVLTMRGIRRDVARTSGS